MRDASSSQLDASTLRIGIAVSMYHCEITDALLAGAVKTFKKAKGKAKNLRIVKAPGAWELTAICSAMAHSNDRDGRPEFNALVALGCILTGETTHDQYIAQSLTHGLTLITVGTGTPVAFGVLTCQSLDQAQARTSKGVEAMQAAIAAARAIEPFVNPDEVRF